MNTFNNIISKHTLFNEMNNLYNLGLPTGLNTGVKNLDDVFRIDRGKLVTVTGIPNMGKSEFLDFLCVQYNKLHNMKTVYFSPENQPIALHVSKLMSKYTHKKIDDLDKQTFNNTVNYISENFYFMNYNAVFKIDDILTETEKLIHSNNINILVIDSYNKLEAQKEYNITETDYISKILDRLERFAKQHNIIVFLVAHPRKMQKDINNEYLIPTPYDINGSANFFNKSDYCITVHRTESDNSTLIRVAKVKFKNYGKQGDIKLLYDYKSGNYYQFEDDLFCSKEINKYKPDYFVIPELKESKQTIDYLDVKVNYFNNISDTTPKETTLKEILLTNKFDNQRKQVDRVRGERDKERKKVQKQCLLNYSVSCTFKNKRDSEDIKELNNLVCIDIDLQDNPDIIERVPNILKDIDNVLFMAKSCSGTGYYCIIPIENNKRFAEHFAALQNDFKSLGVVIDEKCKDVSRVRYFSYDDEYYYNPLAVIYKQYKMIEKGKNKKENKSKKSSEINEKIQSTDIYKRVVNVLNECKQNNINITDSYNNWFNVCMALIAEFGNDGKALFHKFSKLSNKYDESETEEFFDKLFAEYSDSNELTINTLFHLYNSMLSAA